MSDAARVNQNRATASMVPEKPDASRLHGARREVKKANTSKKSPKR